MFVFYCFQATSIFDYVYIPAGRSSAEMLSNALPLPRRLIGRVHVESKDYSADIFLNGSSTPLVHEIDRAAGTDTTEEGALHRVVLRARETPGTISVHEGAHEAAPQQNSADAIAIAGD